MKDRVYIAHITQTYFTSTRVEQMPQNEVGGTERDNHEINLGRVCVLLLYMLLEQPTMSALHVSTAGILFHIRVGLFHRIPGYICSCFRGLSYRSSMADILLHLINKQFAINTLPYVDILLINACVSLLCYF